MNLSNNGHTNFCDALQISLLYATGVYYLEASRNTLKIGGGGYFSQRQYPEIFWYFKKVENTQTFNFFEFTNLSFVLHFNS